jgi:hypothetical protein
LFTPSCAENIYGYRRITQNFRYTKWCQQPWSWPVQSAAEAAMSVRRAPLCNE